MMIRKKKNEESYADKNHAMRLLDRGRFLIAFRPMNGDKSTGVRRAKSAFRLSGFLNAGHETPGIIFFVRPVKKNLI
jgi:hypothetical protein